jgi:hypothetical protein
LHKEDAKAELTKGVSAMAPSSRWNLAGLASRGASEDEVVDVSIFWLMVEDEVLSALGGEVYL